MCIIMYGTSRAHRIFILYLYNNIVFVYYNMRVGFTLFHTRSKPLRTRRVQNNIIYSYVQSYT